MSPADGNTVIRHLRTLSAGARCSAPDEELLRKFVAERDEGAYAALLGRHGPLVWSVCRRLLTCTQDAEDAFQATFLVLAYKARSIGRPKLLANWLFGVARRAALNLRSEQTRRGLRERLCANPPDGPAPVEPVPDDVGGILDEELARLPEKYRLPLLLCTLAGMTHAEAGVYLGWPTGTVAGRLSRARKLLQSRLLRRGVTAPAAALTAVFTANAASVCLPSQLVATGVQSAMWITAGKAAAAGVSPTAVALMRKMLMKIFLLRVLTASVLMSALAIAVAGGVVMWTRTPAAEAPHSTPGGQSRLSSIGRMRAGSPRLSPNNSGKPSLRLPTDPNAVVLRMDRAIDATAGLKTVVTIFADGRVVAEVPEGLLSEPLVELANDAKDRAATGKRESLKVFEGKLSPREMENFMRFALHDQEFFNFDPADVKAAIRELYQTNGNVTDANDSSTASFRIQTAERSHEVKWSGLTKAAWDFPKVERLLQLYALNRKFSQVVDVLLAGGPERVEAVVAKMNELAMPHYQLYPTAPQLTAADLAGVTACPDGAGTDFVFVRIKEKTFYKPLFGVSIHVPHQGEPTIRYVIPPQ